MAKRSDFSFCIAYCGITVAISVLTMFAALIPSLTYLLPAISGLIIWTVREQINRKWALLSFAASAFLCLILVPEVEADIFFVMFFGYYPSVRDLIEKIKPKVLAYIVKLAVFNAAVVIAYRILSVIMNADQILQGLEDFGDMAVYVLWGFANLTFVVYDIFIGTIMYAFRKMLKPKIKSKFKI